MRRVLRVGLVLSMGLLVGTTATEPAAAACHAFTVSVDPAEVEEGASVTVTVRRDANAAPSSVDVATVDETATAGTDYEALSETATFPDGGTSQEFTVETFEVAGDTGSRTFRVEVSNGDGCAVNPNYSYGDPATVTITDTGVAEPTGEPTDEQTSEPTDQAADDTDQQLPNTGNGGVLVITALSVVAALAAGLLLWRRTTT